MALYLISYDLNKPEKDYPKLWEALKEIGAKKVLYSQWAVSRVNTTSAGLRDYIWKFMDSNDRLLVADITDRYAGYNLMTKLNEL
jgi:hypothetical protein